MLQVAAATAVIFAVSLAAAEAPERDIAVQIEYEAPDDCPTIDDFMSAVQRRSLRIRRAMPGESAPILRVRLQQTSQHASGELSLQGTDDRQSRYVRADTCADVAETLALTTALGLDPTAELAPPPSPPPEPEPRPSLPPPPPELPEPRPVQQPEWQATVMLNALQANVLDSRLAWGAAAGLGIEYHQAGSFKPGGSVSVAYARNDLLDTPENLQMEWATLRAQLCPWRFEIGTRFSVGLCGQVDAGLLWATGLGFEETVSIRRPLVALGAALNPGVRFESGFGIQASLSATSALVRREFTAGNPVQAIGQTASVTFATSIGISHTF